MAKSRTRGLREQAQKWMCNHFSITDHRGDVAKLLRKTADAIEKLGEVEVLDIAFRSPGEPTFKEITMSVYFSFHYQQAQASTFPKRGPKR